MSSFFPPRAPSHCRSRSRRNIHARAPCGRCTAPRRCLRCPVLERVQQAGRDDHRFAGGQLAFNFGDDVGIKLRGFGQQDQVCVGRKLRIQVNGNADHAKIIVQEILAGGLIRFVAGDADGVAELAEKRVHLFQGIAATRAMVGSGNPAGALFVQACNTDCNRNSFANPARPRARRGGWSGPLPTIQTASFAAPWRTSCPEAARRSGRCSGC